MATLETAFLMAIDIELGASHMVGATPEGRRRVDVIAGGRFQGPRLAGTVLPGGSDLLLVRADGSVRTDVRLTLRTDDDALVVMTYRGSRHGPDAVMARIAAGEDVDPSEYYLRCAPFFETAAARYDWLNRIVAVGTGRRAPNGARYDVHEVL